VNEVEPRCPSCDVRGTQHIVSRDSEERSRNRQPWFHIIFCAECGHVYNVLTKHVFTQAAAPRFVLPK